MEATIFTGWVYDHLRPHGVAVKVAHPLRLRAIAAAKKKNDGWMRARSPTACAATFCPNATWPGCDPRPAADAALSEAAGPAGDAVEEQDGRPVDGNRRYLQQEEAAQGGYFTEFLATMRRSVNRSAVVATEPGEESEEDGNGLLRSLEQDPLLVAGEPADDDSWGWPVTALTGCWRWAR